MHRSRYQREQFEHRRCTRPGCDRDAVARLTYDIVGCQVWIDGLEGVRGRTQELCELHLGRLTIPRGWALSDRRVETELLVHAGAGDATEVARESAELGDAVTEPVREVAKPAAQVPDSIVEAVEAEAAEPAVATDQPDDDRDDNAVSNSEADNEDELDESIPDELRAGSPLLSRAFRAAGGSKSLVEDTVNPPLRIPETES